LYIWGNLNAMKKILLVLTLTTLIFACKKEDDKPNTSTTTNTEVEGCMDELATNYNPEATEDDGSCEYLPTELKLSSIMVNSMPMTNNGANWDVGVFGLENPDVFYVLKQGAGDIISSTSQDNIDSFPILFTDNLPYTITNLSQEYTIELYDNDQIAGVGENELIGSCSFIPNDFITTGGVGINITNNGIDMTLAIQWIQ